MFLVVGNVAERWKILHRSFCTKIFAIVQDRCPHCIALDRKCQVIHTAGKCSELQKLGEQPAKYAEQPPCNISTVQLIDRVDQAKIAGPKCRLVKGTAEKLSVHEYDLILR